MSSLRDLSLSADLSYIKVNYSKSGSHGKT